LAFSGLLVQAAILTWGTGGAGAEVFGGVDFPAGPVSFADAVAEYDPGFGNSTLPDPEFQNAAETLGPPDLDGLLGYVATGEGGRVVVEFTDNVLVGNGSAAHDLYVFEGGAAEGYQVEVSADGVSFTLAGTLFGSGGIDVDAAGFGPNDPLRFVRLVDDGDFAGDEGPVGADIDAIGALSTSVTHDLTIEKVADVAGAYEFDIAAGGATFGTTVTSGSSGSTVSGLIGGTVVITESVPQGQRLAAVVCVDVAGSPVDVTLAGDQATLDLASATSCTFTNESIAVPAGGRPAAGGTPAGQTAGAPATAASPVVARPAFTG
jgi:hypothetical protein